MGYFWITSDHFRSRGQFFTAICLYVTADPKNGPVIDPDVKKKFVPTLRMTSRIPVNFIGLSLGAFASAHVIRGMRINRLVARCA